MKKIISMILMIELLLTCSACRSEAFSFMQSEDEIACIAITTIVIDENMELQQVESTEISDIKAFIKDFKSMECDVWWGDPIGITTDCRVLKVVYKNADYELIAWNGKAEYQKEKGLRNYRGYFMFNENEFIKLISMYQ